MTEANNSHLKNLYRLLKFIIEKADAKLKMEPTLLKDTQRIWRSKGKIDTGFGIDLDNRRSVTGYLIYLCCALVAWKSKLQNNVTLSSTKGEYVEEGILKIVYVSLEDNGADIMTKNTSGSVFWKHTMKFMDYSDVIGSEK